MLPGKNMADAQSLAPEELAALPHDNLAPRILLALWFTAPVALLFLSFRVYCKRISRRGLWWDDYLLVGSWVGKTKSRRASHETDAALHVRLGHARHKLLHVDGRRGGTRLRKA